MLLPINSGHVYDSDPAAIRTILASWRAQSDPRDELKPSSCSYVAGEVVPHIEGHLRAVQVRTGQDAGRWVDIGSQ